MAIADATGRMTMKPELGEMARSGAQCLPDYSHLWDGLLMCLPMNEGGGSRLYDVASPGRYADLTEFSSWSWDRGITGRCINTSQDLVHNGASLQGGCSDQKLLDAAASGMLSILFVCGAYDGNSNSVAFGWGGTDDLLVYPSENESGFPTTKERVFWRDAGGSILDGAAFPVNHNVGDPTWHFSRLLTFTEGDQRLYRNGREIASSTASLASIGPFDSFRVFGWADSNQGSSEHAHSLLAVWDRRLSPADAVLLAKDPFGFLRRARPAGALVPAAAGGNLAWQLAGRRPALAGMGGLAG